MIKAGSPLGCNTLTLVSTSPRRQPFQIRMTFWHPTARNQLFMGHNSLRRPSETSDLLQTPRLFWLRRDYSSVSKKARTFTGVHA